MNEPLQFSQLDLGFAHFLSDRCPLRGLQKNRFEELLRQLSSRQASGHSCIAVSNDDQDLLMASGFASHNQVTPLIVEAGRLYLHRYWQYEQRLSEQLKALSRRSFCVANLENRLNHYFPSEDGEIDWQRQAAKCAASQALTIISGGPGTGKTTTVLKILALLLETTEQPLHIALTAPTGKAAMRLQESIAGNKMHLPCSAKLKAQIPEKAATLHRLLGAMPPSPYFKHNADSPLPYDVTVIDETSMVDLALMSKLVDALKPGSRLILLGDKDQLASVESGSVLADLCGGLPEQTIELQKSHRFHGQIKTLADAVNQQQAERAWQLLQDRSRPAHLLTEEPIEFIVENYLAYLGLVAGGADFSSIFTAFNRFQVLCANQRGPHSVADINHRVEQTLIKRNKIKSGNAWYEGRPVMISANHSGLQLYNGDIGLCLGDAESDGQLRVFFSRGADGVKKLRPGRLPACETVFAMTIHKSQGSEFENVLLMLPDKVNPVLSKELIYTGITRARTTIAIAANQAVFTATVNQKVSRDSGLAGKLIASSKE